MPHQGYGARKYFLLEGHSRDIAQRIENTGQRKSHMTTDELADAQHNLGLFTGALMAFPAQGGGEYYAICPALHNSQREPDNYYLRVPVSDLDGSHVTPLNATEVTDPEKLKKLDQLFAEGADMIFMHIHSQGPYVIPKEQAPKFDADDGPGM